MRIAFYAPLKPPTHATPSGDRRVAGLLMEALVRAGQRALGPPSHFRGTATPSARRVRSQAILARAWPPRQPRRVIKGPTLVHLPPLLQGARLARPRNQYGARDSLRGGGAVLRAQARRRSLGDRARRDRGRNPARRSGFLPVARRRRLRGTPDREGPGGAAAAVSRVGRYLLRRAKRACIARSSPRISVSIPRFAGSWWPR